MLTPGGSLLLKSLLGPERGPKRGLEQGPGMSGVQGPRGRLGRPGAGTPNPVFCLCSLLEILALR